MKYLFAISTFLFLCLAIQIAKGQDLTKDEAFFVQEAQTYQNWLDQSGIGKVLKVYTVEVEKQSLSLYLAFFTDDADQCSAQWKQLKTDFNIQKSISLEQQLFYKLITIMDVPQGMANVQLYDTYDLNKTPCFFRGIYFDENVQKVMIKEDGCRSHSESFEIQPTQLNGLAGEEQTACSVPLTRSEVFTRILAWAKKRYRTTDCEGRKPEVVLLERDAILRFRAQDICLHVLQDQSNPVLCRMINKVCYKRERLTYTITYQKKGNGIVIGLEVDGRYGSGFYDKVGRKGYHLMDNDYLDDLIDYTQRMREELRSLFSC